MKTKDSKVMFPSFLIMITKKNQHEKKCLESGTEFAAEFERLCKAEGKRTYSIMI